MTGIRVILRAPLLKLGTGKQSKGVRQKRQGHSNGCERGLGCLDSPKEVTVTEASHAGLGALREQVTDAEESPQRQVPGLAWDKLPLPTSPLLASLRGTLGASEKDSKSMRLRKGEAQVCSQDSAHWDFCLKGSYLFSRGASFRGCLRDGSQQNIQVCPSIC